MNLRNQLVESLHRQVTEGYIESRESRELEYTFNQWLKLLGALTCFENGCSFSKRDVIVYLLELYSLKQIGDSLFIDICLLL